eukprot:TRINITY_DN1138_c0_g1_i8.p1 TRINITY_DN1138_c0_g1~~TRINITY_DN1138_c0_g1_i8.p1  ORF type:complete len:107 (-),score=5.25 TRINITY_DN1138_c0_g1_i8:12-332(-)
MILNRLHGFAADLTEPTQTCSFLRPLKNDERKLITTLPNHRVQRAGSSRQCSRLSLIHISEPTRLLSISYAVFCLKKKKKTIHNNINRYNNINNIIINKSITLTLE